jgi:membrane-associated phospholipid phosphatase
MQSIAVQLSKSPRTGTVAQTGSQFLAWPGWQFLRFAWTLSAINAVWFAFVYGSCNWLSQQNGRTVPLHTAIELAIPFVPAAVLAYMSIYLLFLGGPFIVRDPREFAALIGALASATCIGGIGFLLFPSQASFEEPKDPGVWSGVFKFADWLNLDYNMAPSLHVALSVCCITAFAKRASAIGRVLLWTWAGAIAASTLFLHQHHVIDVLSGWFLGAWSSRSTAPPNQSRM